MVNKLYGHDSRCMNHGQDVIKSKVQNPFLCLRMNHSRSKCCPPVLTGSLPSLNTLNSD